MADQGATLRTQEQIENALRRSKLNPCDMIPVTQILCSDMKNFEKEQYRLLELDDHLLKSLKEGDTVCFKGEEDENVMLCTDTRTYDIRECETSNSLIIVDGLKFFKDVKDSEEKEISEVSIMGKNYKVIEVLPCQPPLRKIKKLLNETVYKGPENEYQIDKDKLLIYEELLDKTQVSNKELVVILNEMGALTIDNKIRLLDLDYLFRVMSYMLQSIDENSWALDEINKEETISAWKEVIPEQILTKVFDFFTEKSKQTDEIQLYRYKEWDVCRLLASILLHHASKFNLDDFMQAWNDSVPEGMKTSEEMLHGISVIDRTTEPNTICEFSEDNLPESLDSRLGSLFKLKTKWTSPEITPYLVSFTTDKIDASALLAKHARASTVNGVRYYSAKYV